MGIVSRFRRGIFLGVVLGIATGASGQAPDRDCPQPRFTGKAPDEYYNRPNPLQSTPENLAAGEKWFLGDPRRVSCASCHGQAGDGKGPLSSQFDPAPRDFVCAKTIRGVPDGHLFWIIRFGSPETSMPPHRKFSDEQVWQLVLHLRHLAR
ncbi:MAG TPA: cytochrome c [Usitatibacteraceae bacterium]|nr:cytochrome c [Usitatibacteraceae bacterium]